VGKNRVDRSQNRGHGRRLPHKVIDNLHSRIDRLVDELDISQEPYCPLIAQETGVNRLMDFNREYNR
jgi:hypothetical protein